MVKLNFQSKEKTSKNSPFKAITDATERINHRRPGNANVKAASTCSKRYPTKTFHAQ